jgi:ParB family chromosome partitioning protein
VKDKYEIIAGHRRYKALKLLGAVSVKISLLELDKLTADTIKLSENIYREDLTDIEEAESIAHLMKVGKKNDKQIAKEIGKSLSYVQQKIAILKYPENLREALQDQKITFSVARELIRLKDENLRNEYLRHAIKGGVTPAVAKEWVDDILNAEKLQRQEASETQSSVQPGQVKAPEYFCFACGEKAGFNDSTLVRIHSKCQTKILEGG